MFPLLTATIECHGSSKLVQCQRQHAPSDWYGYLLKQKAGTFSNTGQFNLPLGPGACRTFLSSTRGWEVFLAAASTTSCSNHLHCAYQTPAPTPAAPAASSTPTPVSDILQIQLRPWKAFQSSDASSINQKAKTAMPRGHSRPSSTQCVYKHSEHFLPVCSTNHT